MTDPVVAAPTVAGDFSAVSSAVAKELAKIKADEVAARKKFISMFGLRAFYAGVGSLGGGAAMFGAMKYFGL